MLKWSKYNFSIEKNNDKLLYNSLTNNLIRIEKNELDRIKTFLHENVKDKSDDNSVKLLLKQGFITKSDNNKINNIRLGKILSNFSSNYANICIAPTQDCNFDCSYCFEDFRNSVSFDMKMEQKVVDFICSYPKDKEIFIEWYGGEPLYAFDSIKRISQKLKEKKRKFSASMISNGYLLTAEKINFFKNLNITQIQITLDGMKNTHDKRRKLKNAKGGTFNVIIDNIKTILNLNKNIKIQIRVNIDSTNSEEYHILYNYLNEIFGENKLHIYPGFVEDGELNISSASCTLNNDRQAVFLLEQFEKYGIYTKLYPQKSNSDCMMRQKDSWLIGPNGDLYKCMSDLGDKNKVVGNLNTGITNHNLLSTFLIGADPFLDNICSSCKNMPECGGGCPSKRIEFDENNIKKRPCSVFKNNMSSFIKSYDKYVHAK